jgi:hypothetical protein
LRPALLVIRSDLALKSQVVGEFACGTRIQQEVRVVLDDSPDGKGKGGDPKRFYDNSFIQAVNRDYASKLFPGEVK